jgi:hypothetical protein
VRTRSPRARRSQVLLAGLALVALALGGWVAARSLTAESSEPASPTAALARFRALSPSARTLPSDLSDRAPTPGVYGYATNGSETSHVLGTRRHEYPRRTTVSVTFTPRGCLRTRWDVLATRSDATLACPRTDGSWRLVTQSERHRFAGHLDERTYVCTPDSSLLPAHLAPGTRWRSRCAGSGTRIAETGDVRGPRTLLLRGRRLQTVLLRTRARLSGRTAGVVTTLTWVAPRTRLVLLRTVQERSRTDTPVGDVRYEERATLALASAQPRR